MLMLIFNALLNIPVIHHIILIADISVLLCSVCSTTNTAGKCRQTLRGHVDSVNAVAWQPFTSNVCSASGDKTVSVWDARTGLCVQTLYGHSNSVNNLVVSNRGDMIVSSDADGVVKVWDVRMVAELGTIDAGQHPINKVGK
jgi:sperm-associated antigen 16 protein